MTESTSSFEIVIHVAENGMKLLCPPTKKWVKVIKESKDPIELHICDSDAPGYAMLHFDQGGNGSTEGGAFAMYMSPSALRNLIAAARYALFHVDESERQLKQ